MTTSNKPLSEWPEEVDDPIGREIVLKRYRIVRGLHLQERLEIETRQCAICDFNREIIYYGYYDDKNESFNVCQLCGKDLIERSAKLYKTALEAEAKPRGDSEGREE